MSLQCLMPLSAQLELLQHGQLAFVRIRAFTLISGFGNLR
ncbi:hypothetical protein BRI6_2872 [plant metagenome]|uniref:Uncharacterized protein n=1 Tax=plant metagenome TaxID=1297885 RepID=A0A484UH12_9ZZZZ